MAAFTIGAATFSHALEVLNWVRQAGGFAVNTASGMERQRSLTDRYTQALQILRTQDQDEFTSKFLATGIVGLGPMRVIGRDNLTYEIRFGGAGTFEMRAVAPASPEETAAALPWIAADVEPMHLRDPQRSDVTLFLLQIDYAFCDIAGYT